MGAPLFITSIKSEISFRQFVRYFRNSKFAAIRTPSERCAGAVPLFETGSSTVTSRIINIFQDIILYGEHEIPVLIGGMAFDPESNQWEGFGEGNFILYKYTLQSFGNENYLILSSRQRITEEDSIRHLEYLERKILKSPHAPRSAPAIKEVQGTYEEWEKKVKSVLENIQQGVVDKVVLSTSLKMSGSFDAVCTLERLADLYPNTAIFAVSQARCFLGATPEKLVSLAGDHVETMALAGSSPPGDESLIHDDKTLHEHSIVVEDIISKVKELCKNVRKEDTRIVRLPYINHLLTPITATAYPGLDIVKLASVLHPTPALGGHPRDVAIGIVRQLEGHSRGWYGGLAGYIDHQLRGSLYVAIRSAIVDEKHTEIFAGAGIVKGSNPRKEWEEIHAKFQPVLKALR